MNEAPETTHFRLVYEDWRRLATKLEQERNDAQEAAETFRASLYALEERVEQLTRERDEARQKVADWEQTARELITRLKA